MYASSDYYNRSGSTAGPAVYFGYCGRSGRYRMMDLPEYLSNVQEGMSRWFTDSSAMIQDYARGYGRTAGGYAGAAAANRGTRGCTSNDCHCECCVCDADVIVHARCGEVRRIPVTFENDTRRERPVKLQLDKFVTAGGRDLGWKAQLSEAEFTLRPCDEHTVIVSVGVQCEAFTGGDVNRIDPNKTPEGRADGRTGVDRCEVAYATLRADGCLVRPVVLAVAILPDDCDAYRRPCSCGCCG